MKLWNDGPTKTKIIEFVKSVTDESGPQYLTPSKRIATFDMDGTLLLEKPQYALFDMATKQLLKDIEDVRQLSFTKFKLKIEDIQLIYANSSKNLIYNIR